MIRNTIHNNINICARRLLTLLWVTLLMCLPLSLSAQILIGGNVYGGGNAGNTGGSTSVVLRDCDIDGSVFGGARMANVGGSTFVHIDGEHMSGDIFVNYVYGGNDIAGTIGTSSTLPSALSKTTENGINNTYNSFVLSTQEWEETVGGVTKNPYHIYLGQLFGGGNGDYFYSSVTAAGQTTHKIFQKEGDAEPLVTKVTAVGETGFIKPDLDKTYIEMRGGSCAVLYGGGNNVTVTEAADICIDNRSNITTAIYERDANGDETTTSKVTVERLFRMGLGDFSSDGEDLVERDEYQFARVFGGNNKAEMDIRPRWHLHQGKIRNLYSGGNKGAMTAHNGIFLGIFEDADPDTSTGSIGLEVGTVYGGCRMADVNPGKYAIGEETIEGVLCPPGFAARVHIGGGIIRDVYGGNDISGKVYGGSAVGIHSSVLGDIYGGGNGSYPYTDNIRLKNSDIYRDVYYDVNAILGKSAGYTFNAKESAQALNKYRPHAEATSVRLIGTEDKPTFIGGSVYCGGNSATLRSFDSNTNARAELKIGSYVYANNVFLGSNGENMIKTNPKTETELAGVLYKMSLTSETGDGSRFNSMNFKTGEYAYDAFAEYMKGCEMGVRPTIVFDPDYVDYSTYIGSLFCGGNVGSVNIPGMNTISFTHKVIIYEKLVGGCNSAFVQPTDYNLPYDGGLIADSDPVTGNKLTLNLSGLKIQPKRWKVDSSGAYILDSNGNRQLEWNTYIGDTKSNIADDAATGAASADDMNRRFIGGNIYGGCYNSGRINGNIIININGSIVERFGENGVFDRTTQDSEGEVIYYNNESYNIVERNSGVILGQQGMDPVGVALNVFGGGYGEYSEVWGSVNINHNRGYVFQIFGGGEKGLIGVGDRSVAGMPTYDNLSYDQKYSTTITLNGGDVGVSRQIPYSESLAECEFIYGGGFEGIIQGDTRINLGNGRVFNTFAGSCNADILGHTETYIGSWPASSGEVTGFPWIRDHVYGGNDLGGIIHGTKDFKDRVSTSALSQVYGYSGSTSPVLTASTYMEYSQGRVDNIFGGCYGDYDYSDAAYRTRVTNIPTSDNAFVNIHPISNKENRITKVFGAGQGHEHYRVGDMMQNRSYVLVDIPSGQEEFTAMDIFGAGSSNGVGMGTYVAPSQDLEDSTTKEALDQVTAIIDLVSGHVGSAYGGSLDEGNTRRTMINVPAASTINITNIFGGAFGSHVLPPCDVYESHVNYNNTSENATVTGAIYGGNNNERRTLYTKINISSPVWSNKSKGYLATVYGAGRGIDTWSEYTEVNLLDGARVYEVYGGGQLGHVLNTESVQRYMQLYASGPSEQISEKDPYWKSLNDANDLWDVDGSGNKTLKTKHTERWQSDWKDAWTLENYYTPADNAYTDYISNNKVNLNNPLVYVAGMDDRVNKTYKYNTNVLIHEGATVVNYAYGGGWGTSSEPLSGDVYGHTYIALLGGTVKKDIYAAGTSGSVNDIFGVGAYNASTNPNGFTASANAYIEGGTCRNVYGGGWEGAVGHHTGGIDASTAGDIPGETHVVIGKTDGTSFINGLPAIERNAYGGGEGGAVWGTTNITLNNGYIGYRFFTSKNDLYHVDTDTLAYIKDGTGDNAGYYQEKLHDETWKGDGTNRLFDSGCIFGGGYIDNSSVDITYVKMVGGHVRNSLFGGGEIAAIGRGIIELSGQDNSVRTLHGIYKAGRTTVELYEGNVHRNVFGGGRGYNNLGEGGTLYSDGFVFGKTEVHIYGGTVGTVKELARQNGNVFGGGDIGYVYSAYEQDGKLYVGIKDGNRYDGQWEGYYYAYKKGDEAYIPGPIPAANDENWVMDAGEYVLTEDCKVLIEPHPKALSAVTINGHSYAAGQYVSTEDLHTMGNKNEDPRWNELDLTGIIIYNAVFAGGNTSSGSSAVYANTTTVFGNATASIHDVYHRDLITLGTGRTGGLYGDGNLTFVDGYRGLNITNYGTDYYTLSPEITISEYRSLPAREADYYQLKYKCITQCTDKDGTTYYPIGGDHTKASTLTIDDLLTLFKDVDDNGVSLLLLNSETHEYYPNPVYWEENGVVPVYAGRPMNTLQRADFCGIFGSRMVMQGAEDRVPEIVDHTNYTINRVREVSLNHKASVIPSDLNLKEGRTRKADIMDQDPEDFDNFKKAIHGNYFGIYNIVNYLGALTSDVFFLPGKNIRYTENASNPDYKSASKAYDGGTSKEYGTATFYDWKAGYVNDRKRNNGTSLNKVALASGVYLELTTEMSTGDGLNEKDWGYITGVIELDLINVQPGIGGGFVYAKNVHKTGTYTQHSHNTLTALNASAVTRRDFTFNGAEVEWETSGNFIHSSQTIIDDCYNISGRYSGNDAVPAHYWFIKGSVYVYDQYISAYTGAPNAYSETVDIPLTITAASHGTMKLLNVMPNKYAYFSSPDTKIGDDKKIVINDVEYRLNDPINYWDWYLLTSSEKSLFVDETYVTIADSKYSSEDADIIPAGTVMLPSEYAALKTAHPTVYHVEKQQYVDFDFVYRSSNNMSHNTGYMLTYKVNNPEEWNTWYTMFDSADPIADKDQIGGTGYNDGPTYHLASGEAGVFGQREYNVSNLISEDIYNTYQTMDEDHHDALPAGQATFERAYIVTQEYTNGDVHLNVGSSVSDTQAASMTGYVAPAYICTSTIQLSNTEYIYVGSRMTQAEKTAYYNTYRDSKPALAAIINENIVPAYYCTGAGLYGGDYYEPGKNYRGLAVWSSLSQEDREHFAFNYDAFDVLIDPRYSKYPTNDNLQYPEGQKYQYDSAAGTKVAAEANLAGYSLERPVNYTATYNGSETSTHNGVTLANGTEYSRTDYEKLPNEKRHYTKIAVQEAGNVYVVNSAFQVGNSPYAVGTIISKNTFDGLGDSDKANITTLNFTAGHVGNTYYYCREGYTIGEHTEGEPVTGVSDIGAAYSGSYAVGSNVPVGVVIEESTYNGLPNWQSNFSIHGIAPTETSTLYVSRFSDIFDLSTEKIITVIYQYDYEESDASGAYVTPVSERHVVNIHVQFKSGIPNVEDIKAPQIVLPGTYVGIREPHVTPGAYEVTGGGWKLFEKQSDAESHINGIEYTPTADPLYWYQHGYYLAYYAKTYLGETYSNHVQVSVANYHDLDAVMNDKLHHMYVDNPGVKRDSKIYIDNRECVSDPNKNELDLLKDFFDLSLRTTKATDGALKDHEPLNSHVHANRNLEFFLKNDMTPKAYTDWTSIGDDNSNGCFQGILHGDGHTISGLNNSLFAHLCGEVYNLGVMGSFTSAGIADEGTGYLENCWIYTSNTDDKSVKPLFNSPTNTAARTVHIVNSYYPTENKYTESPDVAGTTAKPLQSFYNGEVTYDLNEFYLFKRYCDNTPSITGNAYQYYTVGSDNTLVFHTGYYSNESGNSGPYLVTDENDRYLGSYVESRFADGDFIYSGGYVPDDEEERLYKAPGGTSTGYYPIWPDDYIFFGQLLNYNHIDGRTHQDYPSSIIRSGNRILNTVNGNRVYRAPAYFGSKVMGVAHFNPYAVFAQTKKDDPTAIAYKDMTAIDFTGYHEANIAYSKRTVAASATMLERFYPPLLDDDGLSGLVNVDLTRNLLAYTGEAGGTGDGETPTAIQKTANTVSAYLTDATCVETNTSYRTVAQQDPSHIHGHWVHGSGTYIATNDHFLVDKNDFNAPIAYTFDSYSRMWYQRTPTLFAGQNDNGSGVLVFDKDAGWEDISLPFNVELVTTQIKGELTHFYTDNTFGHEYWLRNFTGMTDVPASGTDPAKKVANMTYPAKQSGNDKVYSNTFLWDYYYSFDERLDENTDIYKEYYKNLDTSPNTYEDYPLQQAAIPYIVGFPSKFYYEFDLSGTFKPQNTNTVIDELLPQVITFASPKQQAIGVSDDEMTGVSHNSISFKPTYKKLTFAAGSEVYALAADGASYEKVPATGDAVEVLPFRTYFTPVSAPAKQWQTVRSIYFSNEQSQLQGQEGPDEPDATGALTISTKKGKIIVSSTLTKERNVRIVTVSGITIDNYTIQPGETIETPINNTGVYIVNRTKVFVR